MPNTRHFLYFKAPLSSTSSPVIVPMASSDQTPRGVPTSESHTPGTPMTAAQHVLDKGAQILQSLKPVKQMNQHVCTFAIYSHDMTRQIETHHFITRVNQDFLQCAVYDSDQPNARLIGKTPDHSFSVSLIASSADLSCS